MAIQELSDTGPATSRASARRCVIAARPQVNIDAIRALLSERGIEATASYERPWLGARPLDTVMALINDANLVIGILDDPSSSTNLGFELGYAFARDKKIMVILGRGAGSVPSNLASTLSIRADPTDVEAITYNLDALLSAPDPKRRPYLPETPETHPIGDDADHLLERLATAVHREDSGELEAVVVDAIRKSGVSIVKPADKSEIQQPGPDIGIWSDDLESSVGNPLLIDVRERIDDWRVAGQVRREVESYLRVRSLPWGLVVYANESPRRNGGFESVPPVLLLEAGEMIERLRSEGFAAIVGTLHAAAIRGG
jgi:hypothetical protein